MSGERMSSVLEVAASTGAGHWTDGTDLRRRRWVPFVLHGLIIGFLVLYTFLGGPVSSQFVGNQGAGARCR